MDKILRETVDSFLMGMAQHSKTELITAEDELKSVVEKFGLNYEDTRDFGFFKNVYAVTDKANKNGAILPKEIVEANLASLRGKPIDINHEREKVRGFYLGGELIEDIIYSYGVLFKSSFKEDWEKAALLFSEGKLNTSFEIWCPLDKRTYQKDGSYTLDQITFAGGAILWEDTPPAFDEAVVTEFAKKFEVNELVCAAKDEELIYAKIEYECECLKCGYINKSSQHCVASTCPQCGGEMRRKDRPGKGKITNAKLSIWDTEVVSYKVQDMECSECKKEYALAVDKIDYENEMVEASCMYCGAKYEIDMKPKKKKMAMAEKENKEDAKMDELKQQIEQLQAKVAELEKALEDKSKSLDEAQAKLAEVEEAKATISEELDKANEVLKKIDEEAKAKVVEARKEELGDFAAEMSDEDIMSDSKFELAKMKKENAELRAKLEKSGDEKPADMSRGSKDKDATLSFAKKVEESYSKLKQSK